MLSTTLLFSAFSALLVGADAVPVSESFPKVLKFPTTIKNSGKLLELLKRDNIVETDVDIHQILLTFPLTLGGQSIDAVVDTGSRSTWIYNGVNDPNNILCQSNSCIKSTNDITISSDPYAIYYRGNFGAFGDWATAPLSVGNSKSVDFKFGLASNLQGSTGLYSWAGFGYDSDEFTTDSQSHIIDALKDGGAIDKRIFQIEYNNIDNWDSEIMGNGVLTIGGYDTSKNFKFFDMVDNIKYYLAIPISSVGNSNGNSIDLLGAKTAVFDSGSTSLLVKQAYKDVLLNGVNFESDYPGFFTCSNYKDFTLSFTIDSETTFTIPIIDLSWNNYQADYDLCQLMIGDLPDDLNFEIAFGQYAMKNLDVVFDIDNKQLGIVSNSPAVTFT
jgi:hypothetical protein